MTDVPSIKLRANLIFPANTFGRTGIEIDNVNGNYFVDLDYQDFTPPVAGIPDPANETVLLWNTVTQQYALTPITLIGGGGGVPEAPNDGQQYGRQSSGWTLVTGGAPSNANPVMDSVAAPGVSALFARGDHVHPSDTSRAPLASPTFTGVPAAPTASPGTSTTQLATTQFVAAATAPSGITQNSQSANYTTVLADAEKHIFHPSADTTARTWTIDSNANVAYPVGTAITFVNQNAAGVITLAITADTMRLAGPGTTGNRTLAANGVCTALKVTATEWIISGTGLT
jgi:hypothetical protein